MERVRTVEAAGLVNERIVLRGWLHQFRDLGGVTFLLLRDGWGIFQAVVDQEAALTTLRALGPESILEVTGKVVRQAQAPGGAELHDTQVHVLRAVHETLPFELNKREVRATLDTFLNHATVGLRHPKRRAALAIGATALRGF